MAGRARHDRAGARRAVVRAVVVMVVVLVVADGWVAPDAFGATGALTAADATGAASAMTAGDVATAARTPATPTAAGLPVTVTDDAGVTVRFDALPARIVTLMPSLTETAWLLGAGAKLVGVDRYSNWPAEVAALPHLGGLDDARIEAVAALHPDVVLASSGSRAVDRLQALGITVLRLRTDTHADARRAMRLVATLLGEPARADAQWARIDAQIDAAAARVPAAMRALPTYFEVGGGPYAAGPSSFIGETMTRLGLVNVVDAGLGPFPKISPEYVVRRHPALILGAAQPASGYAARPGWSRVPAVRSERICGFAPAQYDILVRPGPRIGEAAGLIADCLVELDARPR